MAPLVLIQSLVSRPGAVAQLGEHLLCKQGVVGSIPSSSTKKGRAPRDELSGVESRSKRRSALFASGFFNQCYRLFFNNTEEVKQILLREHDEERKLFVLCVGRDGLDCIEPAGPKKSGVAGSANACSLSGAVLRVMGSSD